MKNDPQVEAVQSQIGRVQGQIKDNIELVMQRQEQVDVLADKSSNLQESASQFSQVASRIREEQQLQQYKIYAAVIYLVISLITLVSLWKEPGKLMFAFLIISSAGAVVFYHFKNRRQNSLALAETAALRSSGDVEGGRSSE